MKKLIILLLPLILLAGCTQFAKVQKSNDFEYKYELGKDAADVCKTCGNKNFTTYSANAVRFLLEMLKNKCSESVMLVNIT